MKQQQDNEKPDDPDTTTDSTDEIVAGITDPAVRDYVEKIPPEYRPLFDRIHRLITRAYPDVALVFSYAMPTYKLGSNRLHVGVWKHGVSLYGRWPERDAFVERHPKLGAGRGTIRLRLQDAEPISDTEFDTLIRGALER